ncbi:hypothetical protein [Thiocystis violacea]|uniref:hypothetical protein n=1 Tax=Thiocystis violacea TaxID=13725 RepID=UPI0019065896|nr:hypothetical protein [Thiocystis violacea]MBK1721945.1 hypothetical protein [Thiocystis violacea]
MTLPSAPASTPLDLSDITQLSDFIRECEKNGIATKGQLQWWLRFRAVNGLLASGAIVERRINPKAKKAMLFVVRPRFVAWLSQCGTQAA